MQSKSEVYFRNIQTEITALLNQGKSLLLLGPRQTGKTTMISHLVEGLPHVIHFPLQIPSIRRQFEQDPDKLIRIVLSEKKPPCVVIDEAQKVPELFDAVQYLIDENKASFVLTGSSARSLKRRGSNLLPGRVRRFFMDSLSMSELGLAHNSQLLGINMLASNHLAYTLEDAMLFGSMPAITSENDANERENLLNAYTDIYLNEEIRAEALSRKIGSFSRFLELAAIESGSNTNFANLSQEAGVSAPTIREFYSILEDTLLVLRIDPFLKNARKRILSSSRYYFFDTGVRNSLARLSLSPSILTLEKGRLFEHAVILEINRRIVASNARHKLYYWRTHSGLEVDCIIDTGTSIIPVEIKASKSVHLADLRGLRTFLEDYPETPHGYVISQASRAEQLSEKITMLPWQAI